jgi:hypothetical protein
VSALHRVVCRRSVDDRRQTVQHVAGPFLEEGAAVVLALRLQAVADRFFRPSWAPAEACRVRYEVERVQAAAPARVA